MVNRKRLDPTESAAALFGAKLRKLRDQAGLSQAELAKELDYSHDTISKVETASQAPSPEFAKRADDYFETDEQFQELQPLAAKEGIPVFFRPYADLEWTATAVRVYEPFVVTGLFQTQDYAREVLRPGQRASKLEQSISTRMGRQGILTREDPPWIVVLIQETAVLKVVGNQDTTKDQLGKLLELVAEPHINVRVVPKDAQVFPSGGFTLFSRDDEPDIGYVEGAAIGGRVVELSSQVGELRKLWDMIGTAAMTDLASEALIREVWENL
ncbi:helix-turn-helix transcriptional regulator [Actinomadura vinacea]|uniref:Helix-turn-helix transcriptional regulator n=1 Tax=Actinomadura vinacea TaxID=115336 RepID=A0ABP5WH21_9ACTN